ncbi:hypothetical protein DFJ74DRAFT_711414 [Hyaloraphidium curvatum]|nr:hypothetical protein DFJ74DRAFT_711414 [Hyaloraphidium curvatum]
MSAAKENKPHCKPVPCDFHFLAIMRNCSPKKRPRERERDQERAIKETLACKGRIRRAPESAKTGEGARDLLKRCALNLPHDHKDREALVQRTDALKEIVVEKWYLTGNRTFDLQLMFSTEEDRETLIRLNEAGALKHLAAYASREKTWMQKNRSTAQYHLVQQMEKDGIPFRRDGPKIQKLEKSLFIRELLLHIVEYDIVVFAEARWTGKGEKRTWEEHMSNNDIRAEVAVVLETFEVYEKSCSEHDLDPILDVVQIQVGGVNVLGAYIPPTPTKDIVTQDEMWSSKTLGHRRPETEPPS